MTFLLSSQRLLRYLLVSISILLKVRESSIINETNSSARTNFCPLYEKIQKNEIARQNALNGQNITVAVFNDIDRNNLYFPIQILDELSRRAKFNYKAYVIPDRQENETWTDVILRGIGEYDLLADWWTRNALRLSQGIVFPETWYDSDVILVMKKETSDVFIFSAFSKPFSPGLWILLLSTMIITGLIYYFLDFLHSQADYGKMNSTIEGSIFSSVYSYTGSRSVFAPQSRAARTLVISMAFLYLILVSAYTAKLTNFYTAKSKATSQIATLNDVIENNLHLCVLEGFAKKELLQKAHVQPGVLELDTELNVLEAVSKGVCDVGAVTIESYKTYKRDICNLQWVGRRIYVAGASFVLKDSEEYCSTLLNNVLDFYILEMKSEGRIEEIMDSHRESITANTCEIQAKSQETNSKPVTALNMGGAFIFHLFLIALSMFVCVFDYYRQPQDIKEIVSRELRSSIRSSTKSFVSTPSIHEKKDISYGKSEARDYENTQIPIMNNKEIDFNDVSDEDQYMYLKIIEKMAEEKLEVDEHLAKQKRMQEEFLFELQEIKSNLTFRRNNVR